MFKNISAHFRPEPQATKSKEKSGRAEQNRKQFINLQDMTAKGAAPPLRNPDDRMKKTLLYITALLLLPVCCPAQQGRGGYMQYIVEGRDTIYISELPASKVYSRIPRQKGREWRKYYRLVHNFSKTYPYALAARKMVAVADSTMAADKMKKGKREKYINAVQKELFSVFEKPLRNLTVTQGALLMKLIDREVGKSSYNIIRDYKNGIAAGFWQGVAKIFGSDLKKPYDPEGEDAMTEELVKIWEAGDFPAFYFSLFWTDPPVTEIPSKYR